MLSQAIINTFKKCEEEYQNTVETNGGSQMVVVFTIRQTIWWSSSSSSFGRDPHFQMLAVMVLSQHRVSTSKTVSPRIPVGARCTGRVRMMCSAVCSATPHSQFDVGARPHLCMND